RFVALSVGCWHHGARGRGRHPVTVVSLPGRRPPAGPALNSAEEVLTATPQGTASGHQGIDGRPPVPKTLASGGTPRRPVGEPGHDQAEGDDHRPDQGSRTWGRTSPPAPPPRTPPASPAAPGRSPRGPRRGPAPGAGPGARGGSHPAR